METNLRLKISRLAQYYGDTKLHTPLWYRLVWLEDGDELNFIRSGFSFDQEKFASGGWILLFNEFFLNDFVERYPDRYNSGLMLSRGLGNVTIPLIPALRTELNDMAVLLNHAQDKEQSELYLQSYADLILLNANHAYAKMEK